MNDYDLSLKTFFFTTVPCCFGACPGYGSGAPAAPAAPSTLLQSQRCWLEVKHQALKIEKYNSILDCNRL